MFSLLTISSTRLLYRLPSTVENVTRDRCRWNDRLLTVDHYRSLETYVRKSVNPAIPYMGAVVIRTELPTSLTPSHCQDCSTDPD